MSPVHDACGDPGHLCMQMLLGTAACSIHFSVLCVGVSAALQSKARRQAYCDCDGADWVGPVRGIDAAADIHGRVASWIGGNHGLAHSRSGGRDLHTDLN